MFVIDGRSAGLNRFAGSQSSLRGPVPSPRSRSLEGSCMRGISEGGVSLFRPTHLPRTAMPAPVHDQKIGVILSEQTLHCKQTLPRPIDTICCCLNKHPTPPLRSIGASVHLSRSRLEILRIQFRFNAVPQKMNGGQQSTPTTAAYSSTAVNGRRTASIEECGLQLLTTGNRREDEGTWGALRLPLPTRPRCTPGGANA